MNPINLVALDEISSVSGPETFRNPSSNFRSYKLFCNKFLRCELKVVAIYFRKYSYQNTEKLSEACIAPIF